jgi:hypothetical protein
MSEVGRTDRPYSVFPAGEPVAFLGTLVEEKKPKGEFCLVRQTPPCAENECTLTLEMGDS